MGKTFVRLVGARDLFLPSETLCTLIEGNPQNPHTESAFNNPQSVDVAKRGQQVAKEPLARLLSDEERVKYVQTRLYDKSGLVQESERIRLGPTYECRKGTNQRLFRIRSTANPDGSQVEVNNRKIFTVKTDSGYTRARDAPRPF